MESGRGVVYSAVSLVCSLIYAGIVFVLKGFTREEFALFKDLIAFG